jgi:hypothetical protein
MGLLQAGVDRAVIALWLGHEAVETTPPGGKPGRYRRRAARIPQKVMTKTVPGAARANASEPGIDGHFVNPLSSRPE